MLRFLDASKTMASIQSCVMQIGGESASNPGPKEESETGEPESMDLPLDCFLLLHGPEQGHFCWTAFLPRPAGRVKIAASLEPCKDSFV